MGHTKRHKGTNEEGTYGVTCKEGKLDKRHIQTRDLYNQKIYTGRDIHNKKTLKNEETGKIKDYHLKKLARAICAFH